MKSKLRICFWAVSIITFAFITTGLFTGAPKTGALAIASIGGVGMQFGLLIALIVLLVS